tara:strand:+ start:624 stop:1211 length:588 start_codon:yes stop_codon:yes gene_type:complete
MPSLNINDLKSILNKDKEVKSNFKDYKFFNFIETGTHTGTTAFEMSKYFKRVDTIEIAKNLFDHCKLIKEQKKLINVNLHLGDSSILLEKILKKLKGESIFFLDGHYSHGITGRGNKDVPLLDELKVINSLYNYSSVIIIDDARLFGTHKDEDWLNITDSNILKCFDKDKVFKSFYVDDRYVIFLKLKTHKDSIE